MKISGKALALCILHLQVYTPSAFFAQVPCRISKERRNKPAEALHADRPPHLGSSGGDTQSIFHFPNNNNSNNNDVASDDAAPWEDNSGRGAFDDTSGVEAAFEETTPVRTKLHTTRHGSLIYYLECLIHPLACYLLSSLQFSNILSVFIVAMIDCFWEFIIYCTTKTDVSI